MHAAYSKEKKTEIIKKLIGGQRWSPKKEVYSKAKSRNKEAYKDDR